MTEHSLAELRIGGSNDAFRLRELVHKLCTVLDRDRRTSAAFTAAVSDLVRECRAEGEEAIAEVLLVRNRGEWVEVRILVDSERPAGGLERFRRFVDRFEVESDPDTGTMIHLGLELDDVEITEERISRWQAVLGSSQTDRTLYRSEGGMLSNLDEASDDVARLRQELKQANRGVLALYEEIREANTRLQEEIEERKRREAELVATKEELAEANSRLEELSRYDELTGLANRRAFDQELETVWNLSHREEAPLSLAMVDIDHFKEYNDTYGHPAGDEVLERVASTLQEVARRASDLVARYGGEEFAVILPQVPEEEAAELGERMRSRVEACGIEHGASSAGDVVTVSVGVATASDVSRSEGGREELVERADRALYRAKEAGRNRVRR